MQNVQVKVTGSKLVIECDLAQSGQPSASGKTLVIASTRGNQEVAPGVKLGLNLYKTR